mmetsp:Transcript_7156/g.20772  ORF Transcript_7156/g.20772 Transcript_7156/m.20772 type:complete len:221 (+) Transcript_7156:561-1223(+)
MDTKPSGPWIGFCEKRPNQSVSRSCLCSVVPRVSWANVDFVREASTLQLLAPTSPFRSPHRMLPIQHSGLDSTENTGADADEVFVRRKDNGGDKKHDSSHRGGCGSEGCSMGRTPATQSRRSSFCWPVLFVLFVCLSVLFACLFCLLSRFLFSLSCWLAGWLVCFVLFSGWLVSLLVRLLHLLRLHRHARSRLASLRVSFSSFLIFSGSFSDPFAARGLP